jgi:hypothetical protein
MLNVCALVGVLMPRWILGCPHCKKDFTHREITATAQATPPDPFLMWTSSKPEFPSGGMVLVCPNCKEPFKYQRYELIYQSS